MSAKRIMRIGEQRVAVQIVGEDYTLEQIFNISHDLKGKETWISKFTAIQYFELDKKTKGNPEGTLREIIESCPEAEEGVYISSQLF